MTAPRLFDLNDGAGTRLVVTDQGASWLSCQVPLAGARAGTSREVLLAHASADEHGRQPGYIGGVVGRWANRIARARFTLDGQLHPLAANEGPNQLHGGPVGFDKQRWALVAHSPRSLRLALQSPAGDQGYPGALQAEVVYSLPAPGVVELDFHADVDAACPVNLSSHAYFNLDGGGSADAAGAAAQPIDGHRVQIAASQVLPVDAALIPTGDAQPVAGTRFDLRTMQPLGAQAFDHCFMLDAQAQTLDGPPAAVITDGDGALAMHLFTDYPALQFYTGEHLALSRDRAGRPHRPRAGFALEPQYPPDSPNRLPAGAAEPGWLLRPGRHYHHRMRLHFVPAPSR